MSLITFILLNNLKGIRDSDEKSDSQEPPKRCELKKIAQKAAKHILRITGDAKGLHDDVDSKKGIVIMFSKSL